jgi:VWFA-related protein
MPRARVGGVGLALAMFLMVATTARLSSQQPTSPPVSPTAPAAQPPADAPDQQPVFRTGINVVRVDAIVTDRQGNPIVDLKPTDFEVFEDGKPQTIEAFRFVKADGAAPAETPRPIRTRADEEQAAANEDARIFLFFLDDYHVRLSNSLSVRKQLVEFMQNNIGPGDLIGIMYPLTPLEAVTLTRDHQAIIRTLERFEGRKFDYQPRNAIEQRYALHPAEVVERIRRQVALTALEGLAVKLGALRDGRKAVIVVSEGYTAALPPQLRDPVASMPEKGNPARRHSVIEEDNVSEDRTEMSAELDMQAEMQQVFSAANRNNTALYTVDPRGLAAGEFDIDENVGPIRSNASLRQTLDTLRVLADQTDGRAIVNRNDLAAGMKQIVADSSAYYLLAYNSTQAPQDGKFHKIKVRVKRSGADVRSRKGYWALTAVETARARAPRRPDPPPAVTRALSSIAEPFQGRYVRTWVGTTRGVDGKMHVTFVWEPIPAPPGLRREMATSVSLIAASTEGAQYFRGQVAESAAGASGLNISPVAGSKEAAPAGPAGHAGAAASFDVPPGRLRLRISVAGANGALDSEDREMVVPDLTTTALALGTPRVYVARTASEFQVISKGADPTPTASRDFRRTDRLVIRTEAYAPGNAQTTMSSKLLNKLGQRMADVPANPSPEAGRPYLIDLPLAGLAPGEYLLEIAAASEGERAVTELIAFRVGN